MTGQLILGKGSYTVLPPQYYRLKLGGIISSPGFWTHCCSILLHPPLVQAYKTCNQNANIICSMWTFSSLKLQSKNFLSLKRHRLIAHKWAKTYHISLKAAAIKYQYKYLHSHNQQTTDHYHNVQMFYTAPIYIRTSSPNKDN